MAREITRQTTVDAPRERVWAYLTDFGRHTEWADPKSELRITPPHAVRAGATFSSVGKDMGKPSNNAVTITEVTPRERIVFEATQDNGMSWRNSYELVDEGSGTRVTKRVAYLSARFPFNVIVPVLWPMLTAEAAKVYDGDLARIKARLERANVAVAS